MSLTKVSYSMIAGAPVNVTDFGAVGDGVADDTAAIQAAIDSFSGYFGTVLLASNATYRITSSLVLNRGRNLVGDGSPEIVADFSSANWAGDYVALKFITDAASGGNGPWLQDAFGQKSYGFRLTGKNNSTLVSYGVRIYTTQTIAVSSAVQYSFLWGTIENINIRRFDTAIWMQECWNSFFNNVVITYCRRGLVVEGKSVNVTFVGLQIQNPENTYTSSTANTVGILLDSSTRYLSGAEGRPEGLTFMGGLIYGHYNNVDASRCLQAVFNSVIIDGASDSCVVVRTPDGVTFESCYFFTVKASGSCVEFPATSAGSARTSTINNCKFAGYDDTQIGVSFTAGGASRQNVNLTNNTGNNLARFVSALNVPSYSQITDNYVENHGGSEMIYLQTGGNGTIIEGNTCATANVYPVRCHPSTSPSLQIGANTSPTYVTKYAGKVTIPAGDTTAGLPNNFYGSEIYTRAITQATPNGNAGSWYINEQVSWSLARITLGTALGSDIDIRYTVTAIPYLAAI